MRHAASFAALLLLARAPARSQDAGRRIGRVEVLVGDVFDASRPSESGLLYRWANALHRDTRASVICRELLFREGDPYDPDVLDESERNLRRLGFIRRAEITAVPAADGTMDVRVETKDSWTLEASGDFKRVGGRNMWSVSVGDRNFLGYGKRLLSSYDRGAGAAERSLTYFDPQFAGRRLQFSAGAAELPGTRRYDLSLRRPFFSTLASFSAEGSASLEDAEAPVYSDSVLVGSARRVTRSAAAGYGMALGPLSPRRIRRLTLLLRHRRQEHHALPGQAAAPAALETNALEVGARWHEVRFVKVRHVARMLHDEDYNLGPGLSGALALSPTWLGSNRQEVLPRASGRVGRRLAPGRFAVAYADLETAYGSGAFSDMLWTLEGQYYDRGLPRQTLAARVQWSWGHRLRDRTLSLGEDSGLRGYSLGQFTGERRLLVNLEDRVFLHDDLFSLFSLGAAAFVDAGYAWHDSWSPRDVRASAGLGLRLAFSRSSRNEPLRLDLAYALNDNGQRSRWTVSIVTGQLFAPRGDGVQGP